MPETQDARTPAGAITTNTPAKLDREKLCPFLLRMYYCQAQHHRVDDFSPTTTPSATSELRLYTWKNATLGEITSLVKQAIPDLVAQVGPTGQLAFRHIYLDVNRGLFVGKDIGTVRLDNSHVSSSSAETADNIPTQGLFTKDIHSTTGGAVSKGSSSTSGGRAGSGGGSKAYEKTLESIRFVIGDYLDIAITSPTVAGFIPPSLQRLQQQQQQHGAGGGGPIRNQRGGPRSGGGRHSGGGGGGGGGGARIEPLGDRFAGRLGGSAFSRNGHGQGFGGRKKQGALDVHNEPSWKGRGRGR